MSVLNDKRFHNEAAAYKFVEAHVWPQGRVCPHCGTVANSAPLKGKSTRIGVYKCYDCRKPFTVKVGTIFESSHIKLHVWLQAIFLLVSSKKGMSSNQLARVLGITVKSAWFMSHRIREAMREGQLAIPFGSEGGAVESDETFYGRKPGWKKQRGNPHSMKILTLIDRDTGQARSAVVDDLRQETIWNTIEKNMAKEARLMTDEDGWYRNIGGMFADHQTVNHSKDEYVRGDAHVNACEGYFSVFKRGMKGVYQHCKEKHLHRYLAEFDFRYNQREALGVNDVARAEKAILGAVGKRLTYRTTGSADAEGQALA